MPFQKGNQLWKQTIKIRKSRGKTINKKHINLPVNIEKICLCGCNKRFLQNRYLKGYIYGHSQKITRKLMIGNKAPGWKGGKIYKRGYVFIHTPTHPHNDHDYVKRSRLTVEKHLGKYLKTTEIVHHINGIKDDDRIENLVVLTRSEHTALHKTKV